MRKEIQKEEQASYKQIFKATSLFGGVHTFKILVAILQSKIIAVLIGPAGMGIIELLNSTIITIGSLTSFDLKTSAVKNVAMVNSNQKKLSIVAAAINRFAWISGIIGVLIVMVLSSWLSELAFGNKSYTTAFIWISISLLLTQLSHGKLAILQGLRRLKFLAKANMLTTSIVLLVSIPIYYKWKFDGIVPVIIITSIVTFLLSWFYEKKVGIEQRDNNRNDVISEGRNMFKMGFFLSLTGLVTTGGAYILRIYISKVGSIDQVGLYTAGFIIISTYAGLVISAMKPDYFPRLTSVAKNNSQATKLINYQAEIAILILAPILTIFFVFINWLIVLLYTNEFTDIDGMLQWAALGVYFKAVSWSVVFLFLAKGVSRLYFINELIGSIYILGFSIVGYEVAKLDGVGFAYFISYIIYCIQSIIIIKVKYNFSLSPALNRIFLIHFILGILCFLDVKFINTPYKYFFGSIVIILSFIFSYIELEKRIELKKTIRNMINKVLLKDLKQ